MKFFRLFILFLVWGVSNVYGYSAMPFQAKADTATIHSLLKAGNNANKVGDLEKSEELIIRADSLSEVIDYSYGKEKAALYLADLYDNKAEYERAISLMEEAITDFPESTLMAHYYNTIASSFHNNSEPDKALENFDKALRYLDRLPYNERERLHAGILQNKATIYQDKGESAKALENYLVAIEYAESAKDTMFLTIAYNNIGLFYNTSEEYEKSVYYLDRALRYAEGKNSKIDIYRASLNMANVLGNMNRFEEALALYERAGELFSELRPDIPPAIILHNRGATLAKMQRYSEAEELLLESLNITQEMGILEGVYFNNHILGKMYVEQERYGDAILYLKQAVDVANEIGNLDQAQVSRDELQNAYAQANRFKEAYALLREYRAYSDSLNDIVKDKELAELENSLELNRQNEFNRLLEEKQVQQEQQLKFQLYLIIAAAVVIILIIVILFIMRKSAREREEINNQLQQQKLELEEANQAKDKLFAIVSHDLRSPLTSMQGVLHLIKDNVISNTDMSELIPELEVSVQQNVNVMDDLLQWAKEQLSGVEMDIKSVNLNEITSDIVSSQSFIARKKGVSINMSIPENELIKADTNALRLVIRNLISNSIKFTGNGDKIDVNVESEANHTKLIISDTGIGIPKEAAGKIFNSKSWTRQGTNKEKGSGFGLSLSKEFVERMGGKIWFESQDGIGTTFYVELPKSEE